MSSALPLVSGRQVLRALQAAGFEHMSTRGSHAKLRHPDGRVTIVPLHHSIARGTLGSILRQSGLSAARFKELLD